MPTNWSGRPPTSFTQTTYDAHILYDAIIRYDGLTVFDTRWSGRTKPGDFTYYTWDSCPDTWDIATYIWDVGGVGMLPTTWTGRTLI